MAQMLRDHLGAEKKGFKTGHLPQVLWFLSAHDSLKQDDDWLLVTSGDSADYGPNGRSESWHSSDTKSESI